MNINWPLIRKSLKISVICWMIALVLCAVISAIVLYPLPLPDGYQAKGDLNLPLEHYGFFKSIFYLLGTEFLYSLFLPLLLLVNGIGKVSELQLWPLQPIFLLVLLAPYLFIPILTGGIYWWFSSKQKQSSSRT